MIAQPLAPGPFPKVRTAVGMAFILSLSALKVPAWGPHSQITQAALDVLGTNNALTLSLGRHAQQLTNYCWMGDYFGVIMEDPDMLFYADDYLRFPQAPRYIDHTGSEIEQAFGPFFRRALQALRTEDAANAARWIGALLHFVQDATCPAHAAGLRGDVHVNMEWWVDSDRIHLPDHTLTSLGASDTAAFQKLMRRLEELIPQAKERGRRLRVPVEIGNRTAVKPSMLECALESARLSADLLHTLGLLREGPSLGGSVLRGTISSHPAVGMERFPAKLLIEGTSFSTLTDLSGQFEFRHLRAGRYSLVAMRSGNGLLRTNLQLAAGENLRCNLTLPEGQTNLVLNGDFTLDWMQRTAPDYWHPIRAGWEGLPILLQNGQSYRLTARITKDARHRVIVRWMRPLERALPRYQIEPRFRKDTLTADRPELAFTGGPELGVIHLTILGRGSPAGICESIRLEPVGTSR